MSSVLGASWAKPKKHLSDDNRRETTNKLEDRVQEIQKTAFKGLNVIAGEISSDNRGSFGNYRAETAVMYETKKLDDPKPKAKKVKGKGSAKIVVTENIKGIEIVRTTVALQEGLSIVRPLGDGKYEIINIQNLPLSSLDSKGAGLNLDNDLARANAFYLRGDQWVNAITKCAFAARYGDKHIFPFQKLPIELRSNVYELVAISPNGIRPPCNWHRIQNTGIKILHICRDIRDEAKQFFFQNVFSFQDNSFRREFVRNPPRFFQENVREITYHWEGRTKEISSLGSLTKFPQLKILHVTFSYGLLGRYTSPPARTNRLHQGKGNIKRFSVLAGFDKLSLLRGLERVTFSMKGVLAQDSDPQTAIDKADIRAFEKFLNRTLTQPKYEANMKRARKSIMSTAN